ncbi:hypothetical protein Tco_0327758 [Tanacetum coccineum]
MLPSSLPCEWSVEGAGEGEGEGSGEWEGEDVILEGEVKGSKTVSIEGNKATSWPEYPFVGLFILLKTLMLREGSIQLEMSSFCCTSVIVMDVTIIVSCELVIFVAAVRFTSADSNIDCLIRDFNIWLLYVVHVANCVFDVVSVELRIPCTSAWRASLLSSNEHVVRVTKFLSLPRIKGSNVWDMIRLYERYECWRRVN